MPVQDIVYAILKEEEVSVLVGEEVHGNYGESSTIPAYLAQSKLKAEHVKVMV